ncbi:piggyBac transposable element-derived protein 2-like, partial [Aphis craccivora]
FRYLAMCRKGLSDEQLVELLNWDLSDDDLDCTDSEDDMDNVLESIENNMPLLLPEECEEILNNVILENELDLGNDEVFEPLDIMNMPVVLDNCEPNILCNKPPINETLITNISQINNQKLLKSKLSEVQWKKANFYMDPQFLKFETEPLPNKITSLNVPLERDLSIDEQLCATKAHSYLKQYLPLKPHKWGYKFFVMCGSNGFSYRFELYTGQENQDKYRLPSEPDLMANANVVVRLSRIIPENKNHRVFFDNYYTTIPLLTFMAKKGIHTLGTVRRNRLPNFQFISEKIMNNQARGNAFEYITVFDDIPLTSVVWKDNKIVTLLSSYCGILPKNSIKRFDKKTKRILDVNCPAIIKDYNRHMGGVDLLDSLIGRYKIRMRTKKWYMRIWYHLIDVTVVNAWLLYRRVEVLNDRKPTMSLFDFRLYVSYSLTKVGTTTPKRGRPPTSVLKEMAIKKGNLTRHLCLLIQSEKTVWTIGLSMWKADNV